MFWLSHHFPEEYGRCYRFGPLRVCARCLGTYPVLLAVMLAQFAARAPLAHPLDLPVGVGLMLPATLDWASGRFSPGAGVNLWRTLTGVLLGVGLGRSLFIHLQQPWPPVLVGQAAVVTLVGLPVILATYRRRRDP